MDKDEEKKIEIWMDIIVGIAKGIVFLVLILLVFNVARCALL